MHTVLPEIDSTTARTDAAGIFNRPLVHPPLVPDYILRDAHCLVPHDTRFRAAARLLASLWREDQNLAIGSYRGAVGTARRSIKLGSRISEPAARSGATFIAPATRDFARMALLFREPGAVWDEARLWSNLLGSQTLTLNLVAPMAMDLDLATGVWRQLLPDFVHQVESVRFEHSPGRFQDRYFGDGTAFDAIVDVVTPDGENGFIAIEVKYGEDLLSTPARHRERYDITTAESGLFNDPASATLTQAGFEQLRREHVMAQMMVDHGLASRGKFILIGPRLNRRAAAAAKLYAAELADATGTTPHADGRDRVGFGSITVEEVIEAIGEAGADDLAAKLHDRYCAFDKVVRHVIDSFAKTPFGQSLPVHAEGSAGSSKPKRPKPKPASRQDRSPAGPAGAA